MFLFFSLFVSCKNSKFQIVYVKCKKQQKTENIIYEKIGYASYYGSKFNGKLTANGDVFSNKILTGAHKTLPLPSVVLLININEKPYNGLIVVINDRGPHTLSKKQRIIDISKIGAEILGFHKKGIIKVIVIFLKKETKKLKKFGFLVVKKQKLSFEECLKIIKDNK